MSSTILKSLGREYYADGASPKNMGGAVSKSILWDFWQSPYKWFNTTREREITPAMELGTLAHLCAFAPSSDEVREQFVVSEFKDFRTKAAQEWKQEQKDAGRSVVTQDQMVCAEEMAQVLHDRAWYLGDCDYEVAVYSKVGATKVKGMIDIVPRNGNALADFKTTSAIGNEFQITNMILSRGYHWQAAIYLDLWNAASGENRTEFHFFLVESSNPHESAVVMLDEEIIEHGRIGYMNALAKWQECVAKGSFPSAYEEPITIKLPAWERNKTNQ
jgi:hypothetical protein